MGLFGSKKVYVASTVQNLAGDELERPDYLKTTVVGSVLANQETIADTLNRAYLKGPAMKFRSFFRWARNNYDAVGMPTARIGSALDVDGVAIGSQIPVGDDESVVVQSAEIGVADFSYWAEKYIIDNDYDELDKDWSADLNEATGQIIITWDDNSVTAFTPAGFDKESQYIYATYMVTTEGKEGDVETGSTVDLGTDPFPSTTGWSYITSSTVPTSVDRTKTTLVEITYSDGTPSETSTTTETLTGSYNEYEGEYRKETYLGTDSDIINGEKTHKVVEFMYLFQTAHLENQVTTNTVVDGTKTTKTTVTEQVIVLDRSYRVDEQDVTVKEWKGPKMFIYRVGSGNAILDALAQEDPEEDAYQDEFYPFIPIRLDNKFLSESFQPDIYELSKKAFKKAVDGKIDDVIDELSEAESLPDIDYVYAVFGVSVNVLENSCRKYMYNFFKNLSSLQATNISDYDGWKEAMSEHQESLNAWEEWKDDQGNPLAPQYGDLEPQVKPYPVIPYSKITVESKGTVSTNYKVEISWQSIAETTGTGLAKPGAKKNEVWFETVTADFTDDKLYYKKSIISVKGKNVDHIRLYWQLDENNWKALDIVGMVHKNYIYKKKYVEISLKEGLDDSENSGFIVPLHYPTVNAMSIVDTTQMSTACTFLVFNSYVVKKTGLLGSIFFKILLIVVIIIVIVYAPQLAPSLAKAAAATGTAVGLSGTTALIVGAAINAIAAMVLTSVVMKASIAVFGEKLGFIIGTIVSIIAANGLSNLAGGQGLTINFGNMMSAQNLTMLTSTVGNVYAKLVALDTMETMGKTEELQEAYDKKQKEITDAYATNLGYGNGIIDPLSFLDSTNVFVETATAFLSRTLMTGTDISEMSMDMIRSFPELTLSTDLPLD